MPNKLSYRERFVRSIGTPIEGDTSNSIPFPYLDQNTPTRITYEWNGALFTKLFSALKTGVDLMYPEQSNNLLWEFLKGVHNPPEIDPNGDCYEYAPSAPFIKYIPDNPYINDDFVGGWLDDAWWTWGYFDSILPDFIDQWLNNLVSEITGYQSTDVILSIVSLPVNSIEVWLNGGNIFPSLEIRLSGTGSVRLNLLSFPIGGRALIEVDQQSNILDILTGGILDPSATMVELDRDIFSVPPEEYPVVSVPLEITEAGDHVIYVQFLPVINDQLIPIGFGGGLRNIEICGFNEGSIMALDNVIFEDCTLKTVIGGEIAPVAGFEEWLQCVNNADIVQQISQTVLNQSIVYNKHGNTIRYSIYTGTPDSVNSGTPKSAFNGNDQQSINEMCYAVKMFVEEYRARLLDEINFQLTGVYAGIAVTAAITAFFPVVWPIGGSIIGVLAALTIPELNALKTACEDAAAVAEIQCCIEEYINQRMLKPSVFYSALGENCAYSDNAALLAEALQNDRANLDGYLYFCDILGSVNGVSLDDCLCVDPLICGSTATRIPTTGTLSIIPLDGNILASGTASNQNGKDALPLSATGSYIQYEFEESLCLSSIVFNYRKSAGGVNNPTLKFYMNDVLVMSQALTSSNGVWLPATITCSPVVRGRVVRIEYELNTSTRVTEIADLYFNTLKD